MNEVTSALDWYGIWNWIVTNSDGLFVYLANSVASASVWVIVVIAGCLVIEGIRQFVNMIRLRNHLRDIEQAARDNRVGVIEKPSWERRRNKEIKIDNSIYHPLQRDPGGLWLQIVSNQYDVQNQVLLVSDYQRLVHNSKELIEIALDFHNNQHKKEAKVEVALGVLFIIAGAFVVSAYYVLNLLY